MKETDLKNNLDNLIIDGLIKEAEQENADFEAALRRMSEEDFLELIYEPTVSSGVWNYNNSSFLRGKVFPFKQAADMVVSDDNEYMRASSFERTVAPCMAKMDMFDNDNEADLDDSLSEGETPVAASSKWKILRPWIISAVSAIAVIMFVTIPSVNKMNARLCDSALYACEQYMTASKGSFDVTNASTDDVKKELPTLEARYKGCIYKKHDLIVYSNDLREAGWDLALAYLKLHKKDDAIKVLKVLSERYEGTDFGKHCSMILKQLD